MDDETTQDPQITALLRKLLAKYGMGLNHLPSGKFAANGAWLAVQVMAHNQSPLDRPARLGCGDRHDQDPAASAVQPRRSADPVSSSADPPSAGPLAVGDRLDHGPGEAASDPTPGLTAR